MREFVKGKTAIFVAHRLSTIMDCDIIFVLDQGRILESGTHSELIEKKGMYANMWETQQEGLISHS